MSLFHIRPRWASQNQDRAERALAKITDEEELKQVAMSEEATVRTRTQAVLRMSDIALLREVATIEPKHPFTFSEWQDRDVGLEASIRADKLEAEQEIARLQEAHDFQEHIDAVMSHRLYDVREYASKTLRKDFEAELLADEELMRILATKCDQSIAGFCEEHLTAEEDLMLIASTARYDYARHSAIRRLPLQLVKYLIDEDMLGVDEASENVSREDVEQMLRDGYKVPYASIRRLDNRKLVELAKEGILTGDDLVMAGGFQRADFELLAQNEGIKFSDSQYSCPHFWDSKTATSAFTDQDGWWYSEGDTYYECRLCGLIIPC